ncbi:ganglioside-induced differentiation-associated protein 1 [Trichonephila clavata]|uniref:Ganglioside-induced differentiation-associated protein 1 n=1 Tax=Trichonephila clavata TaxID=2740835 RepID=A0A8X6IGR1_TRICU|nr:ganglioside-induced differentiation-associated protein 1 [Trichonephila clavata]
MAGKQISISTDVKKTGENGNGLILYQNYQSYFCLKVVFALHEKKLKFKSHIIDLYRGEQFEPWFVRINPKCEVPVLKDGVKIIPDSCRIIDYIEDNFSNGDTPRLLPEKGSPEFQQMGRMRDLLDNLPIGLVTFGCIFNPQMTGKIRLSNQEIRIRQARFAAHENLLTDLSEKNKEFKDHYLVKKSGLTRLFKLVTDSNEVDKGILDVEYALKEVEKLLVTHEGDKKKWWLCCEKFTIADISLCILLYRLHEIGLTDIFFKDNRLPLVQEYFKRAQQREAYKKTMNQGDGILNSFVCLDTKEQMFVAVGSIAVILAAAGIATFLIHRNK